MPYINEYASQKVIEQVLSNPEFIGKVKSIKKDFNIYDVKKNKESEVFHSYTNPQNFDYKELIVFDGSKFDVEEDSYGISLCNIGAVKISVDKLKHFLKQEFIAPNSDNYKQIYSFNILLPVFGFYNEDLTEKDIYRKSLFEGFKSLENPLLSSYDFKLKESLLDTLAALLSDSKEIEVQPCEKCAENDSYVSQKDFNYSFAGTLENLMANPDIYLKYKKWLASPDKSYDFAKLSCDCQHCKKDIYLTDLIKTHLYIHDVVDEYSETWQDKLSNKLMIFLEKLYFINFIRNVYINKRVDLFKEVAFMLDGSLAMFGEQAWLSKAIEKDLFTIQEEYELFIIGVEKSGLFHSFVKKSFSTVPINSFIIFDEKIIKNKIYLKRTYDKIYGEKTHFGKKLWIKNNKGYHFIINLAYQSYADKYENFNIRNEVTEIQKIQNKIENILYICEYYMSEVFVDGLFPISIANESVALSKSEFWKSYFNSILDLKV